MKIIEFVKIKPNLVKINRGGKTSLGRRWFKKSEPLALPGSKIGQGKVSDVFELDVNTAFKAYRSGTDSKILQREVANLKFLNDKTPGVAPKYVSHNENGIAMERVGGKTLETYFKEMSDIGLPPYETAKLGEKVGDALNRIHNAGFAHGDLTENNIVVDALGKIRLLDLEDSKVFKPKSKVKLDYFDEDVKVLLGGLPGSTQRKKLFTDGFFRTYEDKFSKKANASIEFARKKEKIVRVKAFRRDGTFVNPFNRKQQITIEGSDDSSKNAKQAKLALAAVGAIYGAGALYSARKVIPNLASKFRKTAYAKAASKALPAPKIGEGVYATVQDISESQVGKVLRSYDYIGTPEHKLVKSIVNNRDKEFEILNLLQDTGVVPKLGTKNRFGFTIEKIEGETLFKFLKDTLQEPSENQLSFIGEKLGNAVSKVHKAGILHGDLHINNVLITKKGDLKIIDFGEAVRVSKLKNKDRLSDYQEQDLDQILYNVRSFLEGEYTTRDAKKLAQIKLNVFKSSLRKGYTGGDFKFPSNHIT